MLLKLTIRPQCPETETQRGLNNVQFLYGAGGSTESQNVTKITTKRIEISLSIGNNRLDKKRPVKLLIKLKNGNVLSYPINRGGDWNKNSSYTEFVDIGDLDPSEIQDIGIKNDSSFKVNINNISFRFLASDGSGYITLGAGSPGEFKSGATFYTSANFTQPAAETNAGNAFQSSEEERERMDQACAARLLAHINCNKLYYNQVLWLTEDLNSRICRFQKMECDKGKNLLDIIDPNPLGLVGCGVVYGLAGDAFEYLNDTNPIKKLVTLPTSGVHADAALGQCSTCEKVNDDEYRDWSDSPCNCGSGEVSIANVTTQSLPTADIFSDPASITSLLSVIKDLTQTMPTSDLAALLGKLTGLDNTLLTKLIDSLGKKEEAKE